jgi:hypothetical protein
MAFNYHISLALPFVLVIKPRMVFTFQAHSQLSLSQMFLLHALPYVTQF